MSFFFLLLFPLFSGAARAEVVEIRIGGTGGALGAARLLADRYCKDHPEVRITVLPSLGSNGGIKAVMAGAIDIGLSSRLLKESEQGVSAREFGRTPLVFVVQRQAAAAAAGVTLDEIADIYEGKKGTWSDGSRIRVVMRPASEYDFKMLESLSPRMEQAISRAVKRAGMIVEMTDQDNLDAIEKTPGAFGTSTLGQVLSENRNVKTLMLNSVKPSIDSMQGGTYPLFKTYYFIVKTSPSKPVQQFLEFTSSRAGIEILTRSGYQATSR